jgi:hypothetical protein
MYRYCQGEARAKEDTIGRSSTGTGTSTVVSLREYHAVLICTVPGREYKYRHIGIREIDDERDDPTDPSP